MATRKSPEPKLPPPPPAPESRTGRHRLRTRAMIGRSKRVQLSQASGTVTSSMMPTCTTKLAPPCAAGARTGTGCAP